MQVNPNSLLSKTLALSADERRNLPGAYQSTMAIFAKYVPEIGAEKLEIHFTANKIHRDANALVDAAAKLSKAEKLEKMHKILSITLLAVTISLVAAAILLTVFINPLFMALLYGLVITTIAASILQVVCSDRDGLIPIPFAAEAKYIYKAFKYPNEKPPTEEKLQADIEENKKKLERDLERLQVIHQHQDAIRSGIRENLNKINLGDYKSPNDVKYISVARTALQILDEAVAAFEMIQ